MKKSWFLITITFILCFCGWWTKEICASEKGGHQKRLTGTVSYNQPCRNLSRLNNVSIYNQLAKNVDLSSLKLHTTFSQAIEILRSSTVPKLNIVVLWRNLSENALVERDTPIMIEGVSGIPLRTGLELVLRAVSSGPVELGYVIEGGVVVVAAKNALPVKRVTRVYDISDLISPPANYNFGTPFATWGPAAFGFGGGWMGQRPVGVGGINRR
jgi:hypothetical protein